MISDSPKKRRVLPGHRATKKPLGPLRGRHRVLEGWSLSCTCGWSVGPLLTRSACNAAYTSHVLSALPVCSACNEPKPTRMMSTAAPHLCKSCSTNKTKLWALENPKEWNRHRRKSHLMRKYGITPEEFDRILAAQGGACAICKTGTVDSRGFRPHVDHCHKTGAVRGILCGRCNIGLGQFCDDPALLTEALSYLLTRTAIARAS